jgi:hypothetical protein
MKYWLITTWAAINGAYFLEQRTILKSNSNSSPYTASWFVLFSYEPGGASFSSPLLKVQQTWTTGRPLDQHCGPRRPNAVRLASFHLSSVRLHCARLEVRRKRLRCPRPAPPCQQRRQRFCQCAFALHRYCGYGWAHVTAIL